MSTTTFAARVSALPCFHHVHWHPDRAELRRFAWWMLGGFAILGGMAAWRMGAVGVAPLVVWGLGAALAASTLVPHLGRAAYLAVYLTSGVIGYVVSRVVLTAIFYLVFTPIGVALRVSQRDLLGARRPQGGSTWIRHQQRGTADSYYRQF